MDTVELAILHYFSEPWVALVIIRIEHAALLARNCRNIDLVALNCHEEAEVISVHVLSVDSHCAGCPTSNPSPWAHIIALALVVAMKLIAIRLTCAITEVTGTLSVTVSFHVFTHADFFFGLDNFWLTRHHRVTLVTQLINFLLRKLCACTCQGVNLFHTLKAKRACEQSVRCIQVILLHLNA